jgi:four helix bundle protein
MRSQLERAAASVVANIAEAAGRESVTDRKRHWAIARGSATEAGGLVEVAWRLKALGDGDRRMIRSLLLRTTWMLTAMIRR